MSSVIASDPGAVSWQVGQVRITRVEEVTHRLPVEQFILGATTEIWRPFRECMSHSQVDNAGTMSIAIAAYVVESRGHQILVDTCIGSEHPHGGPHSPFLDRLAAAGFPPKTIDAVVCTHFHFDHVGWNTTVVAGQRRPTFERAKYFFVIDEWNATHDEDPEDLLLQSVGRDVRWIVEAGLGELVSADHRLTDEVSLIPTFGHSPGHVSVLIRSGGAEAVITGDAAHHPLQLMVPELTTTADFDGATGVASRRSLIDRALDRDMLIIGTHFAAPSALYVRSGNGGARLLAPGER
jgi:glyoxylase-like metal-dependent hydrolase (beta-lactamase superfamily II)